MSDDANSWSVPTPKGETNPPRARDGAGEGSVKRFLLFAGMHYYPEGGWADFRGDFDSSDEAIERGRALCATGDFGVIEQDWWHVVDIYLGVECASGTSESWT